MANVSKTTRAGKHGKKIRCPTCEADTTIYHFAWSALVCSTCKTAHEKHSWKEVSMEKSAYQVMGKYRTYHNQFGIGTLNAFHLEVRADDIESARKIAVDKITSDGRRHADSVCDIEISLHKETQEGGGE